MGKKAEGQGRVVEMWHPIIYEDDENNSVASMIEVYVRWREEARETRRRESFVAFVLRVVTP